MEERAEEAATCGENHVLGDELVVHNGELGQLNPVHACHRVVPPPPVELDVVGGVAVLEGETGSQTDSQSTVRHTDSSSQSDTHTDRQTDRQSIRQTNRQADRHQPVRMEKKRSVGLQLLFTFINMVLI